MAAPSPADIYQVVSELTADIAFSSRIDEHLGIVPEWANHSFENVVGYTFEELTAIGGWKAIVHPDDAPVIWGSIQELVDGAAEVTNELRVVTKSGDVRWLRTFARAQRDSSGTPVRVIGAAQDVTDRVAAEERYRTISDLTSDVTFSFRVDQSPTPTTEWVAGAHTELTGYTLEETDVVGWRNLIHPADRAAYEDRLARLEEGDTDESEVRIATKGGDVRHVRIVARRIAAPAGTMRYVGAVRDLTERRRAARMLAQSEARYRAVSQLVSDVAYSYHLDEGGRPVVDWVTDGIEDLTGYTAEEMASLGGWKAILSSDQRRAYEERLDTLFAGQPVTREFEIVTKGGERRWVEISARPEMGEDGRVARVYGAVRDVSERRSAEDALATREAQLREAQAVAKMGSWRRDVASGRLEWSDELFRLAGYEPGEVEADVGWLLDHIHPDDRAGFSNRLEHIVETGEGHEQEFRFVRPDGRVIWAYVRSRAEHDAGGRVVAVHGIAQDVTERRRHQELHRAVSELVSDILFSYRVENGRLVADWVTGAYERITGHALPEQIPTDLFGPVVHPNDAPIVDRAEKAVLRGEPHVCELRIVTGHQTIRWLKLYVHPVTGELEGEVVGAYGAAQDITATKEAEAILRRAYERERSAATRLREADRLKDEFLTTASHELRTPLTAIVGFASALGRGRHDFDDDTYGDIVGRLERNALELGNMVERLLDFSRLEAGAVQVDMRQVMLGDIARQCVETRAAEFGDHEVTVDVAPDLAVEADPAALTHVLGNLAGNAVKYAPGGSAVTITARPRGDDALVEVVDHGPGIPPEERQSVFDRFVRGTEQPPGTHGSGIGLAIARSYVELMGGRIWVEETPGGGATICFLVPLAARDRAAIAEPASPSDADVTG